MIDFSNDYMEGAHPSILQRLAAINLDKRTGYGLDDECRSAKERIREACGKADADVFFLVGGTQTNALVIDGFLDKCEGVFAADTGHIAVHESGAVEAWGHKVITLPGVEGRLRAEDIDRYMQDFLADSTHEHIVPPGMVYISFPTECGTLYSLDELRALRAVCSRYKLPLFLDGARLGYGLAAKGNDVTLKDIAHLCDAFYIGGTKVGALFGEAVVVCNPAIFSRYRMTLVKRHGALLAKGWLLGVQFDTLFTDNLYMDIARNAIDKAKKLRAMLIEKGYRIAFDSPTNQQFAVVSQSKMEQLRPRVGFAVWGKTDEGEYIIRFVTSWATTDAQLDELRKAL